nr:unnamed protein product [Digitaria exilis]
MAQQSTTLGDHEHHVHVAPADTGDTPEKKLNGFVRAVALIERAGNALGTLAFTWATVVLLGGYPTVLRQQNDFWFATAIVFLEASRMFSRNNRLDYQLFFDTKGVMVVFMMGNSDDYDEPDDYYLEKVFIFVVELCAIAVLSLGNLQIPAAIVRVVLALLRLVPHDYYGDNITKIDTSIDKNWSKINLAPSLNIFYGMVLGQGVLYSVACILEIFSFIPRRYLARRGGFGGRWGLESVNLYYAYAFEKYLHGDVLAPKNISLNNFAIDSLNSDTPKMQFTGIRIMHSLLQKHTTRRRIFLKANASTETMTRLINMLDWTSPEDTTVRLFAAKVTAELSTRIRVVTIPGTVQVVSALLGYSNNQQRKGNPLLDTNFASENVHDSILNVDENQEERLDAVPDTVSLLEFPQDRSTLHVVTTKLKSWISKCFQWISKFWSVPQDEPLTEQDLLPALGMSILNGLAGCDQGNCAEISRESGLIPKIIGFTSCRSANANTYTEAQRKEEPDGRNLELPHAEPHPFRPSPSPLVD